MWEIWAQVLIIYTTCISPAEAFLHPLPVFLDDSLSANRKSRRLFPSILTAHHTLSAHLQGPPADSPTAVPVPLLSAPWSHQEVTEEQTSKMPEIQLKAETFLVWLSSAAVRNDHNHKWIKKKEFIISQVWRLEIQNQSHQAQDTLLGDPEPIADLSRLLEATFIG